MVVGKKQGSDVVDGGNQFGVAGRRLGPIGGVENVGGSGKSFYRRPVQAVKKPVQGSGGNGVETGRSTKVCGQVLEWPKTPKGTAKKTDLVAGVKLQQVGDKIVGVLPYPGTAVLGLGDVEGDKHE